MPINKEKNAQLIKHWAKELGFTHCGIAQATFLEEEAPRLESWLKQNFQGEMHYMENHFDMRLDPRLLVPEAKSVISLSYNYYNSTKQPEGALKIAKYAFGEDYHFVVKDKLKILLENIQTHIGEVQGRCFTDSAPILEHAWAKRAGVGWQGKHSLLLQKQRGSFFFLAEIILDVELEYDIPFMTDHCGTCTACIDACPTNAIMENRIVNGSKCISYATIELKDDIPDSFKGHMEDWMFGCDICQDVCPWNRFSQEHNEPRFLPNEKLISMHRKEWIDISKEVFSEIFKKSPVKRTKYEGLKRNIDFIIGQQ
mgnify:FL=1